MPTDRDEKILKHIGRYGLTLRAVVEHLFFDGREKACDAVLNRLVKDGLIMSRCGLPGGLNYYQLSKSETSGRDASPYVAREKKSGALRRAVQVLWFCCMANHDRSRIDGRQIEKQFGMARGIRKPHCRETRNETPFLYRIYTPGPGSRDDYLLKVLRGDWVTAEQHPVLGEWLRTGSYRFAVLTEVSRRKEKIQRALAGSSFPRPHVEIVPSLRALNRAIADFKKAHPLSWYASRGGDDQ